MAFSLKLVALCCALMRTAWGSPTKTGAMSLRLASRKLLEKSHGHRSLVRQEEVTVPNAKATLLVIPANATGDDILLRIRGSVEQIGPSEDDMWIRRVQASGKWLKNKWAFKTGSGTFGDPSLYQARLGHDGWTQPVNLLKASDGLLRLSIHDKQPPTRLLQQSIGQEIHLVIGPVTLGVKYLTSNKGGAMYNHLEIHLAGLTDVVQPIGGVLMGDTQSFQASPHMAILQHQPTYVEDEDIEDEE